MTRSAASRRTLPVGQEQPRHRDLELEGASEPVSLEVALSRLFVPDREVRRSAAESVTAALQPDLRTRAYIAQHADRRQGGRRPAAQLPALAREPQPRQRGLRRVRRGADRRRPRALRASAPLVPAQGAAARHRPARRLRPHGGGHAGRRAGRRGPRPRAGARRPTARSRDELGALAKRFFDESLDRRAGAPGQARRRVLRLHGAVRAPVRAPQLHGPAPRRADARARARPRRARGARRPPGRLPHGDAADAGRDRAACSARRSCSGGCSSRRRPPSRGCRCWPSASRARSRPSSARWR